MRQESLWFNETKHCLMSAKSNLLKLFK